MNKPQPISRLRANQWADVPDSSGVYWWFFPIAELSRLGIDQYCDLTTLKLRQSTDGEVCLYHGLAKSLSQRVAWHAEQKLLLSYLKSGFLSTFRFTLLALNDFDYGLGANAINRYFDSLTFSWQITDSRGAAQEIEHFELTGEYHYPLNIQGNKRPELRAFTKHLKSVRRDYRKRYTSISS